MASGEEKTSPPSTRGDTTGHSDAIPELIAALGERASRTSAEEALREIGEAARDELLVAALRPLPSADYEDRSSKYRRQSALRLLGKLQMSAAEAHAISSLVHRGDKEIAVRASRIALATAEKEDDKRLALCRLLKTLPDTSWSLQIEIESWFLEYPGLALSVIEEEMNNYLLANGGRLEDDMFQRLLTLKRKIEERWL